jgi:phosphoserine phosphatase
MSNFLQSWNDGPAKQSIIDFVTSVTDESGPSYVPPVERIATIDNDGTLWCEKPVYIQLAYLIGKLAAQAEKDPSLQTKQPWKAVAEKKYDWLAGAVTKHYQGDDTDLNLMMGGILGLAEGRPAEQAEAEAREFVFNEQHPSLGLTYKDTVFQPMIELLQYLEANNFTNYIVSGGGRDFMRDVTEELYNVPRERVLGTRVAYRYEEKDGVGEVVQTAKLDLIDDGPGKATEIWNVIGRRPILVGGNSNGDLAMMSLAEEKALRILIVHDDAEREFDYVAGAEKAIAAVKERNWTAVSVKNDWKTIFKASE